MRSICIYFLVLNFLIPGTHAFAQDKAPVLKGQIIISIQKGTIECELELADIPRIKDYLILLNAGMNIRTIRNEDTSYSFGYERAFKENVSDEAMGYYIPSNKPNEKYIPGDLHFSYVGKFPVVADTFNAPQMDWKGNIAFNGYSVRSDGLQAAWYPVMYDIKKDRKYERVKCDIQVTCSDCNTIYVNGNVPQRSSTAHFKNDMPFELMLFAGNYAMEKVKGTYFLNPDISTKQINELADMTDRFKKYYETKLGIPYKYDISYVQTTPVSKENAWLFVSYPTIVNVGRNENGLKQFFAEDSKDWVSSFLTHELGHYYFGYYKYFNTGIGDACSEGFAEYLSLRATKALYGDSVYTKLIDKKIKELKDFKAVPPGKIRGDSDYHNRELYVYYYFPIILSGIREDIGAEKMWAWLREILQKQTDFTNYDFLLQTLSTVLNDERKLQLIKEKYLESDASLEHAIARMKKGG